MFIAATTNHTSRKALNEILDIQKTILSQNDDMIFFLTVAVYGILFLCSYTILRMTFESLFIK